MRQTAAMQHPAPRALALLGLLATAPFAQEQPNVIVVITDDQGYGDIAAHGNEMIRTPHLDALHAQSVRLTDFHVDPTCSPTRSALMSGRYSTRTGVWHTIMGRSLMDGRERTLAEVLRDGGYDTGMFGKWHLGENAPMRPIDQGFRTATYHGGGGVGQGPDWFGNDYFDDTYFRDGVPEAFEGYCTDIWFDEAMAFIAEEREGPFFCYLSTNAPHGPLLVEERWSQPYAEAGVAGNQSKFYGMIENIDWNMGRLVGRLDELGLSEDTLLLFMTDNGTAFGEVNRQRAEEGLWAGFGAGMRGKKGSEYDGGHRVPSFWRWPAGGIGGGRDEGVLSAHIDVLPTIAELCGVERGLGPPIDGSSLAQRLRDPQHPLPERTLFVHSQRLREVEKWRKCAVMTERWRLVNGRELYDIQADPAQASDLAESQPEVVAELRAAYEGWWESLSPVFDHDVRIHLGDPAEALTQLHPHDWQVAPNEQCSWHQNHVRNGHMGQGSWYVDVRRGGTYEFELRRWPRHQERAVEAVAARLQVGEAQWEADTDPEASAARFEVELEAGASTVKTWFRLPEDGGERGAYFVYVRYLD